jgi:hypothetical protein
MFLMEWINIPYGLSPLLGRVFWTKGCAPMTKTDQSHTLLQAGDNIIDHQTAPA